MKNGIMELLLTVGICIVGLAGAYATMYLKKAKLKVEAGIEQIKNQEQRELLYNALDQLDVVTQTTVQAIEQTIAKDLRNEVKQGNRSKEELKALAYTALANVCEKMKPEYLAVLELNIANLEEYMIREIESKVLEAKSYNIML